MDPSRSDRARLAVRSLVERPAFWPVAIFTLFLLLRIPFRAHFLVNWDAVNFALGMESFDIVHHQPHPPGYIGYVLLAKGAMWIAPDANAALTGISILAGAVAPAALYVLVRRFATHRHALGAAVLFGTTPLVWYYSSVALTYIVATAVTIPLVWACHVARTERSERHLIGAAVLLAVLGALRQTDLALLLPVLAYAAIPFAWRARTKALATVSGLTAVWLVPLVWAAGGLGPYVRLSRELAGLAGGKTWILSMNLEGVLTNVKLVGIGVVLGMSVGLLVVPAAFWYRVRPLRDLSSADRRLLAAWAAPALATYLFLHTGQMGYVLLFLPIGFLLLARTTQRIGAVASTRWDLELGRTQRVASGALSVLVGMNLFGFFVLPDAGLAPGSGANGRPSASTPVPTIRPILGRQYNLVSNDRHWRGLIDAVERTDPQDTVVLADPTPRGTFRHMAYYLPGYWVYGVGFDLEGRFGHLFVAHDRRTTYSVEDLNVAAEQLALPPGVERVVITDTIIADHLAPDVPRTEHEVGGLLVTTVRVPKGSALLFERDGSHTRIVVRPAPEPLEAELARLT